MAVTWNYGGGSTVDVTLDTTSGVTYTFVVDTISGTVIDSFTGTGSPMTRTSSISGFSVGDFFDAYVYDFSNFTYLAANNFTYGTASTTGDGLSGVWSYDGADTITFTFTSTVGLTYFPRINYFNGGTNYEEVGSDVPGTGGSQTLSISAAHTPEGTFMGWLETEEGTTTGLASRLFDAGTASSGMPGNPGGGVTAAVLVGRVLIAFDDGPLAASPTWTAIDQAGDFPDNFVAGYEITCGRQTLISQTDTGTATVDINDHELALFDPRNVSSPYFGKLDGRQILLQLYDPVRAAWEPQFQGHIDNVLYDVDGSGVDQNGDPINVAIQLECVDIFDFLAGYGLTPGLDGITPRVVPSGSAGGPVPAGFEDGVYYAATSGTVDDRIIEILADVGIDPTRYVVASGNVKVIAVKYDPDESALVALRDACDAEFPFIANMYVDRRGLLVFRGRYSRFAPDDVAAETGSTWDFHRWAVGDGKAIQSDPTRAQMRILQFGRGRRDIINAALAFTQGIDAADMPGQVFADTTSIDAYGKHQAQPMSDLITSDYAGPGTISPTTGQKQCALYAELLVKNQKDPRESISSLQVKAIRPDDPRASATWTMLTRADISHIVNVAVDYPGGTGFAGDSPADDYYIEGRRLQVKPLNPDHDYVELDLEVSPAVWSMDTHGVFPAFGT